MVRISHPWLIRRVVLTATFICLGVRGALALVRWLACFMSDNPRNDLLCVDGRPVELSYGVLVGVVLLTIGLTVLQSRRREGHVLFGNLGVSFQDSKRLSFIPSIPQLDLAIIARGQEHVLSLLVDPHRGNPSAMSVELLC